MIARVVKIKFPVTGIRWIRYDKGPVRFHLVISVRGIAFVFKSYRHE